MGSLSFRYIYVYKVKLTILTRHTSRFNILKSCDLITKRSATKIMSVLSFVQILRGYFLFATVGFVFINEGEHAGNVYNEMSHYMHDRA